LEEIGGGERQDIAVDNADIWEGFEHLAEHRDDPPIQLNRNNLPDARSQVAGEVAKPGADLEHGVLRL
jgi:hypothetical protein